MPKSPLKRALYIEGGTLWIALREGHSVWRMDLSSRRLAHVAGSGKRGYRDGAGQQALFNGPKGIVRGAKGTLYVVDTENQVIREVDPASGEVGTVAGIGPQARGYGGDGGPAVKSKMDRPHGVTVATAPSEKRGNRGDRTVTVFRVVILELHSVQSDCSVTPPVERCARTRATRRLQVTRSPHSPAG